MKLLTSIIFAAFFSLFIGNAQMTLTIGSVNANSDGSVFVPVSLTANPNNIFVPMGQLFFDYDNTQLTPVGIATFSASIPENLWAVNLHSTEKTIGLAFTGCTETLGSGTTLFLVEFKYTGTSDAIINWSSTFNETILYLENNQEVQNVTLADGKVSPPLNTSLKSLEVGPNPLTNSSSSYLHIHAIFDESSLTTVKLVNMQGITISEKSYGEVRLLDVEYPIDSDANGANTRLINGVYIIEIRNNFGVYRSKISVAR